MEHFCDRAKVYGRLLTSVPHVQHAVWMPGTAKGKVCVLLTHPVVVGLPSFPSSRDVLLIVVAALRKIHGMVTALMTDGKGLGYLLVSCPTSGLWLKQAGSL